MPGFWGGGFAGGNGWGSDPNPGRRGIDTANNTNDQRINQTLYGGDSISIDSWLCFGGVCWYAGSGGDTVITGVFPSDFTTGSISPILGFLGPKDWRPEWPRRVDGYDPKTGWRTQPPPKLEQFPKTVRIGEKGLEVRPEFDPERAPSNASRGRQIARGVVNALGKLGGIFGAFGGFIIDLMGPVIQPGLHVDKTVCRQHPTNPGCGSPG